MDDLTTLEKDYTVTDAERERGKEWEKKEKEKLKELDKWKMFQCNCFRCANTGEQVATKEREERRRTSVISREIQCVFDF